MINFLELGKDKKIKFRLSIVKYGFLPKNGGFIVDLKRSENPDLFCLSDECGVNLILKKLLFLKKK